jgi:hypothetical protein
MFFAHVEPCMNYMKEMLEKQMPPALVIPWARQRSSKVCNPATFY